MLRLIADPIYYQYRAAYELTFDFQEETARRVRGEGLVRLYFVDAAPAVF